MEEPLGLPTGRLAWPVALTDFVDFAFEAVALRGFTAAFLAVLTLGAALEFALTGFFTDLATVALTVFLAVALGVALDAVLGAALAPESFLALTAVSFTTLVLGLPRPLEGAAAALAEAFVDALAAVFTPTFAAFFVGAFLVEAFFEEASRTAWAAASRAMGTL